LLKILQTAFILMFGLTVRGSDLGDSIVFVPEGMGTTTGYVINLSINNRANQEVQFVLGPFLIPSADTTQGYVVAEKYQVRLSAGEHIEIPLYGYCTNPFLPPVAKGGRLKPFKEWVQHDPAEVPSRDLFKEENGYRIKRDCASDSLILTHIGTDEDFCYLIDIDSFPNTSVSTVVRMAKRVETAFDKLEHEGLIETPFKNDKLKEKESVIQQTLWIALSLLEGSNYNYSVFRQSVENQYLYRSSKSQKALSDALARSLDNGLENFWNTFLKVGIEAKILKIK